MSVGEGPMVVVEELSRAFGDFVAVDRVSFEVARGEIFGFLGPNGAGKTTTIKMLAGLLTPTGGRGRVATFDVASESERIKSIIGYMSQLFSLYGDLTVKENLDFFGGLYGLAGKRRQERAAWALEMSGLEGSRRRLVRELPLGFKQRLALGCAVLHEPPVLFLDEPTSGVDPLSRRAFWDLIYHLAEEGTTIFVTTHYMEEAEYCHRLALMNRGRLIALGAPQRLRSELSLPLFEVRSPDAPGAARALSGAPGVLAAGLYGRTVHALLLDAVDAPEVLSGRLGEAGIEASSIERIEPSLEDVFAGLVEQAGGAPSD